MNGTLLANLIWIFHLLVVLFVIVAPFSNVPIILLLHSVFCLSLLVHWYTNNNICSLSLMESQLRGLDYTESFTHRLIAPMYDISKTQWANVSYTLTLLLFTISTAKIYNNPNLLYYYLIL
jgi:hypothetical protein